ncbi:hypothetical protein [Aquincola tertiaricarbonis]
MKPDDAALLDIVDRCLSSPRHRQQVSVDSPSNLYRYPGPGTA